jgi:hypothetical protein
VSPLKGRLRNAPQIPGYMFATVSSIDRTNFFVVFLLQMNQTQMFSLIVERKVLDDGLLKNTKLFF